MDIQHLPRTGDAEEVLVIGSSFTFTVKVSGTLIHLWGVEAVDQIAEAIVENHKEGQSYQRLYEYRTDNSETSLERMLDWVKRNQP